MTHFLSDINSTWKMCHLLGDTDITQEVRYHPGGTSLPGQYHVKTSWNL